jgi:FAD/FMN-containing dehydrogenase
VIVEIDEGRHPTQLLSFLESLMIDASIADGTVATSSSSFNEIWAYREDISESISMLGSVHKNDVAVPVSSMPSFLGDLQNLLSSRYQDFDVLLFGHIGDGNIHINVIDRSHMEADNFQSATEDLDLAMCELIRKYGGSVSAEHGIGLLKKRLLYRQRSEVEIQMMKSIKRAIDPKNLFNPGKIVDV